MMTDREWERTKAGAHEMLRETHAYLWMVMLSLRLKDGTALTVYARQYDWLDVAKTLSRMPDVTTISPHCADAKIHPREDWFWTRPITAKQPQSSARTV